MAHQVPILNPRGEVVGVLDLSGHAAGLRTGRKTDGKANLVTNQACFGCTIACGRIAKLDETHFTVINRPQYWGASCPRLALAERLR
jgi:aldehyde:ferredoxin oxidoreductase